MADYKAIDDARFEMDSREREERMELLKEHKKKFSKERVALQKICEEIGHERGRYWDNGLGWEWHYCCHCDAIMDMNNYYA